MSFWQKIKQFFKGFFSKNIGEKIAAVSLALLLWIIFAAVEDPAVSETYTIPLTVRNLEEYEDAGHYAYLQDGSDLSSVTLDVSIRAPKSVLQELSLSGASKAIEAVADIFDVENGILQIYYSVLDDYEGKVEFNSIANVSFLNVVTEEVVTKTVPIELDLTGSLGEGLYLPNEDTGRTLSATTVTVSGPESLVSKLAKARVQLSLNDLTASVENQILYLQFLDTDGKELTLSSTYCDFSATLVTVSIPVYRAYDLKLTLATVGTPPVGYSYLGDGELSKTSVAVYTLIENAAYPKELTIIQNLSEVSGSIRLEKDLSKLLEQTYSGVYLQSDEDSLLIVTINCVQDK